MINRQNWKAMKAYLQYRQEVDQVSRATMRLDECRLRHLLHWAEEKHFSRVHKIRPTCPEYLKTARLDGKETPLSPAYTRKLVRTAKRFLTWLRTHRRGYGTLSTAWLDSPKPPREVKSRPTRQSVTLDESNGPSR